MNGKYYQNRQLSSGEMALVEMIPPPAVVEAEKGGNAQVSSMMFRGLEGETLALLRKVAFNPEAFTYFTWVKRHGFLDEDDDFADFVNYCITLCMTKIFGARVSIQVNTANTLMGELRKRQQQGNMVGVEFTT